MFYDSSIFLWDELGRNFNNYNSTKIRVDERKYLLESIAKYLALGLKQISLEARGFFDSSIPLSERERERDDGIGATSGAVDTFNFVRLIGRNGVGRSFARLIGTANCSRR